MKQIFFIACLFCTLNLFSESEKSLPAYYIKKDLADPSVNTNKALVEFTFYDASTGKPVKEEIRYSCNGENNTTRPDGKTNTTLTMLPGKYVFQFYRSSEYFEIKTDSIQLRRGHRMEIQVNFHSSTYPVICDKPVIYIYPDVKKEISVKLDLTGKLNFTYPAYNGEWKFTADTSGKLFIGGRSYDYLFWEGETGIKAADINTKDGFIVSAQNLVTFFEEKLSAMGLNEREQQDFITYWVPQMQKKEKVFIHFLFREEFDSYAALTIDPKPYNFFRVFMLWSDADNCSGSNISEQKIPTVKRNGYTILEWGGGMIELHTDKL